MGEHKYWYGCDYSNYGMVQVKLVRDDGLSVTSRGYAKYDGSAEEDAWTKMREKERALSIAKAYIS